MEGKKWAGIDYGSKLAGTTAVVYVQEEMQLQVRQSQQGKDADKWLAEFVKSEGFNELYIDAPLSLPKVYSQGGRGDFFYRACDRQLNCMSPMFLGGLTARAIRLKEDFSVIGINCFETYPAALAKSLLLQEAGYKKKGLEACLDKLEAIIPKGFHFNKSDFSNWHRFDALLAWISAYALKHGQGEWIGEEQEGLIGVYRPSTI